MAIERKQFVEKAKKKSTEKIDNKKVGRNFKPDSLPDAIVEGKFTGQVGSEIVVSRFRNGKNTFSVCTVKQLDESGLVHTFDETLQQWFVFSLTDHPKIIKLLK